MAQTIAAPRTDLFTRINDAMEGTLNFLARNNPRFEQFRALQQVNDAEFAARGDTRAQAVRRTFRNRFYL